MRKKGEGERGEERTSSPSTISVETSVRMSRSAGKKGGRGKKKGRGGRGERDNEFGALARKGGQNVV